MRKVQSVRKLRHWKQRFKKGVKFIWRKDLVWAGKKVVPGTEIPKSLEDNPAKVRRFWESGAIELRDFEEPNVLTGRGKAKEAKAKAKEAEAKAKAKAEAEEAKAKAEADEAKVKAEASASEGPTAKDLIARDGLRRWSVKGLEGTVTTKKKALAAAQALLDSSPVVAEEEDETDPLDA